jgi:ATP-dependent RNA helicase HelY
VTDAVEATIGIWVEVEHDEAARGLTLTREPDAGFVWPVYRWARGEPLSKVLGSVHTLDGDLPAGDFVRWGRQVVDLLGQIAQAPTSEEEIPATARAAIAAMNRGVLAYTTVS